MCARGKCWRQALHSTPPHACPAGTAVSVRGGKDSVSGRFEKLLPPHSYSQDCICVRITCSLP